MPVEPYAAIEITAFEWVPEFAQGFVRDLRPRWLCEEAGLPYRERLISAIDRPDWYHHEQPWGQAPFLRADDEGIAVFESGAILVYLAERTGKLLPANGQARAETLGWLFGALNSVEPSVFELGNVDVFSAGKEWAALRRPSLIKQLGRRLAPLEARLAEREWLTGTFSIADIAMVTVLRELKRPGMLDAYPALAAYVARGEARPAFATALEAQLTPFAANVPATLQGA